MMEEEFEPGQFGVTPALFEEWRVPRLGNDNPQRLKSKVWEWLVYSRLSGYGAEQVMLGSSPLKGGPTWCFDRFGQSVTELSDGRTVYIGGEHEDYYMPNFYIYNDVVVIHPDRIVDFYCYRESDFPQTDFHTATLVGEKIVIIGSLGYLGERKHGSTQLYVLDLGNFKIQKPESSGTSPGWIHSHYAILSEDKSSIIVTHGKVDVGEGHSLKENTDDWKLTLHDWRWERLTERTWTQFEIRRKDQANLHLFLIRTALWYLIANMEDQYQDLISNLSELLGFQPDVKQIKDLYNFDMEHGDLQNDEDIYNLFYFDINGTRVRFTEEQYSLQVVIEGALSDKQVILIKQHLIEKVSALLNAPCEVEEY